MKKNIIISLAIILIAMPGESNALRFQKAGCKEIENREPCEKVNCRRCRMRKICCGPEIRCEKRCPYEKNCPFKGHCLKCPSAQKCPNPKCPYKRCPRCPYMESEAKGSAQINTMEPVKESYLAIDTNLNKMPSKSKEIQAISMPQVKPEIIPSPAKFEVNKSQNAKMRLYCLEWCSNNH